MVGRRALGPPFQGPDFISAINGLWTRKGAPIPGKGLVHSIPTGEPGRDWAALKVGGKAAPGVPPFLIWVKTGTWWQTGNQTGGPGTPGPVPGGKLSSIRNGPLPNVPFGGTGGGPTKGDRQGRAGSILKIGAIGHFPLGQRIGSRKKRVGPGSLTQTGERVRIGTFWERF